jgi:3-oxoacyl-[acyl-carrier-protein] synthase II
VSASPIPAADAPVAITGLGLITPLGDRPEAVAEAMRAGRSALAPAEGSGWAEARIADFEATRYANIRGLRLYSRPTRMGICAARLALSDSGLESAGLPAEQLGTVTASTFGHLETLLEYDRSVVAAGPLRGNPALMPLSLPSSPGAAVALSFGAKAFSMSLSDGATSSLDALGLGARLVAAGRARACLVVGAFGLCPELSLAASRAGLLAPAGAYRVLDRRRRGSALGEGAGAVVLERVEDARARGAEPRGLVLGQAGAFALRPADRAEALRRACEDALRAAGLAPGGVGLVSSGANGSPEGDAAEARALAAALGPAAADAPVMAVKSGLGDSIDASGMLQALAALAAMRSGRAPPILGLEDPEVAGLRYLTAETAVDAGAALVTSAAPGGACSALVLARGG